MRQAPVSSGLLSIALAAALLPAIPAPAAADGPVVVRTYDASGIAEADHAAARYVATAILEEAGLDVVWLACDRATAGMTSHPCLSPLGAHELAVRLVRLSPQGTDDHHVVTLGYSLVETEVRVGSLATIYVERVAGLAASATVDLPTLLGRAIAHEIGHLLLGTGTHSGAGVMRAVWSPRMLRRNKTGDWAFTTREAKALRDAVRRRAPRAAHTW